MVLTIDQWHQRFIQQAQWTSALRKYLFQRLDESRTQPTLEVGCGTGAVLGELFDLNLSSVYGLDINIDFLKFARQHTPQAHFTCADAYAIPYPANTFDLVICHFFFLWIDQPVQVLSEMVRVTQNGGIIVALAEPDYGGRIDYPDDLSTLGEWQEASLHKQGADTHMGRQLQGLFSQAKLEQIETGVLGAQWRDKLSIEEWESEWEILKNDLSGFIPDEKLDTYRQLEELARSRCERVLFVPTFYASGIAVK